MPAATQRQRKKQKASHQDSQAERGTIVTLAAAGAVLGLSAPGFEQWFLAWAGLVPLLLLVVASEGPGQAFLRGAVFALGYNLVYLNWYLGLHPLTWLGFNPWASAALAAAAWVLVSTHQAVVTGCFAALARLLPLSGGFLPRPVEGKLQLPSLLVLPLAWVLLHNKLGNAHDLLGVPWSMLEYSQYRQLPLIQVASLVGGVGIGALLVMSNTAIAGLVATLSRKLAWQSLAARTTGDSIRQLLCVALLVAVVCAWGASRAGREHLKGTLSISVVQGNVNIDMQKTEHRYSLAELLRQQAALMQSCPPGLCILAENAVPTYLRNQRTVAAELAAIARSCRIDLVFGCLDRDSAGRPYNSAFGIARDGTLLPDAYYKRYLVPFGEYAPALVEYMPEWIHRLTNTPAGGGFAAGKQPVVLSLPSGKIAPLICFETISPELVAASVRKGGTLIVNLSDLAWFHDSMIGDQMVAFAVVRAVENGRYFVFAANSGPSAIIGPTGQIAARSPVGKQAVLVSKTANCSEITPFTFWFR